MLPLSSEDVVSNEFIVTNSELMNLTSQGGETRRNQSWKTKGRSPNKYGCLTVDYLVIMSLGTCVLICDCIVISIVRFGESLLIGGVAGAFQGLMVTVEA